MYKLVRIFKEEKYIGPAFIEGMKFRKGSFGWYPTLEYLTLTGEKLEGWECSAYPFLIAIEYKEDYGEEKPS
jgi:hypothetical protein